MSLVKQVHAMQDAFRAGCDDEQTDAAEREAIGAFVSVLGMIVAGKSRVARADWVGFTPPPGTYTAEQEETLVNILQTVLDNKEALKGLLHEIDPAFSEVDEPIGAEIKDMTPRVEPSSLVNPKEYQQVMEDLFSRVLDFQSRGFVTSNRLHALKEALKEGCSGSQDDEETDAMEAFMKVLDQIATFQKQCSRQEWAAFVPQQGSYTEIQESTILGILRTVLKDKDSAEGLREIVEELEEKP